MLECPSAAALAGFGTDMTQMGLLASLEGHIDGCPECQKKLEGLARADLMTALSMTSLLPIRAAAPIIPGFVIERELGRGSTGVVYQALEPSLGRRVALKVVRSGPAAGSHDHARWLREARSFARVRHDNVVRLYQVGEADGWLFMVLELVPGGTLQQRLNVPYAPREAALLLETIARAVIAIHREGLVHLDLKPSNILLDGGPEAPRELAMPRVGDFGIAFRCDEPDASLATALMAGPVGTPSYMAPEQIAFDREKLGPAADVYGLGAILYHLLTGHRPFVAAHVIDILDQVRNKEPVAPRRLNPTIPRDLETICLKCLQKEPGRRYGSAGDLAEDLRRWLDGRPIAARPVSIAEKSWKACRRRPAVAGLALALVFTLAAGFLGMFRLWRQAESALARAEVDNRLTVQILGEDVALNAGGPYLPRAVAPDQHVSNLRRIRERLRDVATRPPVDAMISRQLAIVGGRLGHLLIQEGQWDEARSAFEESLSHWDRVLREAPHDRQAISHRIVHLCGFASVAEHQGNSTEHVMLLRQAVGAAEELMRDRPDGDSIGRLAKLRNSLASLLDRQGAHTEAMAVLDANRRMLASLPADAEDLQVVCSRIIVQWELDRLIKGRPSPPASEPRTVLPNPMDNVVRLASPEADRLSPQSWAELAIRALREGSGRRKIPVDEADSSYGLIGHMGELAALHRRTGALDEASRVAERMLALGRLLVEHNPNRPMAHIGLSEAYIQINKNAWQTHDRAAIGKNLRLSLDAALRALVLDPNNEIARYFVEHRQRRLNDLPPPRPGPEHPERTVMAGIPGS